VGINWIHVITGIYTYYSEEAMATQQQSISSAPYAVLSRKERSRELAQKRRTTYKSLMKDLADELPFSKDVISQVDYNSRLRLALCFFRMKSLAPKKDRDQSKDNQPSISMHNSLLQDLLTESLDGFIIAILGDGTILYVSESIHKHLGLFQSEHIGSSFYDLIHNEDYASTQESILKAGGCIQSDPKAPVECSFFCRMKCSRFKVSNAAPKSPGHKVTSVLLVHLLQLQ
jgi:PAS domain-containing protein